MPRQIHVWRNDEVRIGLGAQMPDGRERAAMHEQIADFGEIGGRQTLRGAEIDPVFPERRDRFDRDLAGAAKRLIAAGRVSDLRDRLLGKSLLGTRGDEVAADIAARLDSQPVPAKRGPQSAMRERRGDESDDRQDDAPRRDETLSRGADKVALTPADFLRHVVEQPRVSCRGGASKNSEAERGGGHPRKNREERPLETPENESQRAIDDRSVILRHAAPALRH
ncbi:MAG: hypothetical protein KIT16_06230, partial [Rhodospirillaceae bacterium]|nr:hypothetical protein [Rhodospirillaceae bacterium]